MLSAYLYLSYVLKLGTKIQFFDNSQFSSSILKIVNCISVCAKENCDEEKGS